MTASKKVRFDATIKRRDLNKLQKQADATKSEPDYSIELSEAKRTLKNAVRVHVEITGDNNRAGAFKKWVQEFALQSS